MSEVARSTQDRRKSRGWWHEEAKEMKRSGITLTEIAAKFGRHPGSVYVATKGVRGKPGDVHRKSRGATGGFEIGSLRRVAIGFTGSQVEHINSLALKEGISFSLAVSNLVDFAIQEHRKANDA